MYAKTGYSLIAITHHAVIDFKFHRTLRNLKNWISQKRNTTFIWNKKFYNLYLKKYVLTSYHFVSEVTFN